MKLFWAALLATQAACGQTPPLYQNADAPLEKRVDDLLSRMTGAEKGPARPRHGVPEADRTGRDVGSRPHFPYGHGNFRRGPRQEQRVPPSRQAEHLPGTDFLDAEYQPGARPALGPRDGGLRRRSVSGGAHGGRVHQRTARQRPEVSQSGGHRQALRGAQRTRNVASQLRRQGGGYGSGG